MRKYTLPIKDNINSLQAIFINSKSRDFSSSHILLYSYFIFMLSILFFLQECSGFILGVLWFRVLNLSLLIHMDFIFVYSIRSWFNFFFLFCMCLSRFPSMSYWGGCLYRFFTICIIYPCLLCQNYGPYRCGFISGLFYYIEIFWALWAVLLHWDTHTHTQYFITLRHIAFCSLRGGSMKLI